MSKTMSSRSVATLTLIFIAAGVGLAGGRAARAEPLRGGAVPPLLAKVRGTDAQEQLAQSSLTALVRAVRGEEGADALLDARGRLVLLADVGLRHVAERLATGDVSEALLPHLLHVVATSEHPSATSILARAAGAPRSEIRMRAADGLGRERSTEAAPILDSLARDPVPGVRAAALRSLFALDTADAISRRRTLPIDARTDLHARRLRWHRVRGHPSEALLEMAVTSWREGATPAVRLEAARLLVHAAVATPLAVVRDILQETGSDALGAALHRLGKGVERHGYDPVATRTVAILAAWRVAHDPESDPAARTRALDRAVGWLAEPIRRDPLSERPVPENLLRMVLPDLGGAIVEPTVRRLRQARFEDPQDGITLLVEGLPGAEAAAIFRELLDPNAEPPVPTAIRVAASGGLRAVGGVGDEALASRLLEETELPAIRRNVLSAVAQEEADWVAPQLGQLLRARTPLLWPTAVRALESRLDDPAVRPLLIEHLFSPAPQPEVRMQALVEPADAVAYEVLERALTHPRGALRRAALRQLHQVKSLRTDRARELLRRYEIRAAGPVERTHEMQQLIYAYARLLPADCIPWMRRHWKAIQELAWAPVALRTLQNVRSPPATAAVIDFVLESVAEGEDPELLREAATALEGRRGHRDGDLDAFWRRLLLHPDPTVRTSAVLSLDHPGRGDLTDLLLPRLAALDFRSDSALDEALSLLDALEHQPFGKTESAILGLVVDEDLDSSLRRRAAEVLDGRASGPTLARLADWLTDPDTLDGSRALLVDRDHEKPALLRVVARTIGEKGGSELAARGCEILVRRLRKIFDRPSRRDPTDLVNIEPNEDLAALARTIAFAGQPDATKQLVALLFDDLFARYARRAVEARARRMGPMDATATARGGPDKAHEIWHWQVVPFHPIPAEVTLLVENLKPATGALLAQAFRDVLASLEESGRLAAFPDSYLDRIAIQLLAPSTGVRDEAADLLQDAVAGLEPGDSVADFFVAQMQVERRMRARRFADAAAYQKHVLRILSRRSYDDAASRDWRRQRAVLDALQGAARQKAGDVEAAERLFERAVARHPYDAWTLAQVARLRTLAGGSIERALALVTRARVLQRRVFGKPGLFTGDTFALVLLHAKRYDEAVLAIEEVLPAAGASTGLGGRYHLRWAQTLSATGRVEEAGRALSRALVREPTLAAELAEDPYLAPLRDGGSMEETVREALEQSR